MSAATFKQMYPKLETWMQVKKQIDYEGKITSDLAKRLQL
jgi:hypothetical protein